MPVYVALGKCTDEGLKNLTALADRHQQAVKRAEGVGGKVIGSYAVMGHYDFVVILEAPDEKVALRILTREASGGNVRYETMTAIPTAEFAKAVE